MSESASDTCDDVASVKSRGSRSDYETAILSRNGDGSNGGGDDDDDGVFSLGFESRIWNRIVSKSVSACSENENGTCDSYCDLASHLHWGLLQHGQNQVGLHIQD